MRLERGRRIHRADHQRREGLLLIQLTDHHMIVRGFETFPASRQIGSGSGRLTAAAAHPQAQDTMEKVEKREELNVREQRATMAMVHKLAEDNDLLLQDQELQNFRIKTLKQEEGPRATLRRDVIIFILMIITHNRLTTNENTPLLVVTGSLVEVADSHQVNINSISERGIENENNKVNCTKPFHQKGEIITYSFQVRRRGVHQSELWQIISRHATASNHMTKGTISKHREALAEQAERTTECRVRQARDDRVRMATRMTAIIIMMTMILMPTRPPVRRGTQSLHREQGLLAFLGNMNLQSEERKSGEKQVKYQGIDE